MKPFLAASAFIAFSGFAAFAQDKHVQIINQTGYTITHFYGSNTGSQSWEEDILGNDVLPPGASINIDFEDGSGYCMFGFRAIFEDGEELIKEGVDVCQIPTFTYN